MRNFKASVYDCCVCNSVVASGIQGNFVGGTAMGIENTNVLLGLSS